VKVAETSSASLQQQFDKVT